MPVYEIFKKQVFTASRVIKADSREKALEKFDDTSSNIDSVAEDDNPVEEIEIVELNDCDESDVDY